ncbi:MAG: glycosyltransferase [Planctomycetes bacterium]|nr:glycosyltransferase [Planctomycetota bacterium]
MNSDIKRDIDILFVGSITPRRKILLEKLQSSFHVTIANAFGRELVQLFNRSKIVLNIHAEDHKDTETRVFEALGCGSFLLTERLSVENPFSCEHLVEFETFDELCDKINFYLDHANEREEIAMRGYAEAVARHTYTHRADEIIKVMSAFRPKSSQQNENQITDLNSDCRPKPRKRLRIFATFRHINWEDFNLQPALESMGEVVRFKWDGNPYDPQWDFGDKQRMNSDLIKAVQAAHREQPIDVFFSYLSGRLVSPGIIRAIGMAGIPTLNICLDDKTKFYNTLEPTGFTGMADIANAFTMCWTSTEDAVKAYESVKARAIYLPEGANPEIYRPLDIPFDIDVSFVGQCYGQRPSIIEYLKSRGVSVQTFGRGWPSGEIPVEDMVRIYNRSRINLGFAAVGNSKDVCCLKGRDFEVPMSGGLYLTQYHPELENVYEIGKEIVCYKNLDELAEKIHYYLAHPQEAEKIMKAGMLRARREHTWFRRFERAFAAMGIPGFEPGANPAANTKGFSAAKSNDEPSNAKPEIVISRHTSRPASSNGQQLIAELRESISELMASTQINTVSHSIRKEWVSNQEKLMQLIMNEDPRYFLNWDIIIKTMFVGNAPCADVEYAYLKNSPDWNHRWQKAIEEIQFGQPVPYTKNPFSSPNLVHHAYHLAQLEEKADVAVQNLDTIIEYGGGYGSMCRLAYNLGFRGTYIIIDLPAFSALQRYFLKSIGLPVVATSALFSENKRGILLLPNINNLPGLSIAKQNSAFIGTWSLSETPIKFRESVFPVLSSFNYLLFAYQEVFCEENNVQYFSGIKNRMQNYQWRDYPIVHIPGNRYLIGIRS